MNAPLFRRVRAFDVDGARRHIASGMLSYTDADPYAVTLLLGDAYGWTEWLLSRDDLADSGVTATGAGDVRMSTVAADGEWWRRLRLTHRGVDTTIDLAEAGVELFLKSTFRRVPRGAEATVMDGVLAPDVMAARIDAWNAQATCPTCHAALGSLLATCRRPACLKADLDATTAQDLNIESSES